MVSAYYLLVIIKCKSSCILYCILNNCGRASTKSKIKYNLKYNTAVLFSETVSELDNVLITLT